MPAPPNTTCTTTRSSTASRTELRPITPKACRYGTLFCFARPLTQKNRLCSAAITSGAIDWSILWGLFPTRKETDRALASPHQVAASRGRQRPASGSGRCASSGGRSVVRPCAFGLLALAIAVVLWGLAYKLSLYNHPGSSPRAVVAKLWTGPRSPALVLPPMGRRSPHVPVSLDFLPSSATPLPHIEIAGDAAPFQAADTSGILRTCLHLRSPPPPAFA